MIATLDELCPAYFSCCYWIQAFETFCLYLYCSHYCVWSLIITVTYSVQFVIVQMMKWICSNKHLKWWQKPQVLQWLSSLISNHFSYPNQRCLLHPCFVFFFSFPVNYQMSAETEPQTFKTSLIGRAAEGRKMKRSSATVGNEGERTSFCIVREELKGMQMSSHPSPSQVTGMSGSWKPLQYNYTPSYLPQQRRCCSNRSYQIPVTQDGEPRGIASLTKPISFAFKYL